ncbi:MAG: hypothetical protein QOG62_388 [Thermoleophilaceae bacterium]|jgi:hypothetical protein|nr:hypothetical protein [Thermoleophilaceae bacterium]
MLALALIAGALFGSQADLGLGGGRLPAATQRLGDVSVRSGPDGPRVVAEIGKKSRAQLMIWRQLGPQTFSQISVRRVGVLKPGPASIPIGLGHTADASAPGKALSMSRVFPLEVRTPSFGMRPGRYGVQLQLRSPN